VYISDATETGGVYTKAELTALSACCREHGLLLFLDGARLAPAFGAAENDLTLPDLARLCDAFYLGGTKNGALMGEALVIVAPSLQPGFFRLKKQRGAVLAKGWLLGVQFEALLKDGLYWALGRRSTAMAQRLRAGLEGLGVPMAYPSPSNLIFPLVPDALLPRLDRLCTYEVWEKADEDHSVIRLVASFATTEETVDAFLTEVAPLL
ncbi:MAG TPA: beta-eliminating lyase-related protein, partial [Pseudoflavonifractor sp.]|nr:beta-eliminating lyase-related protein [Pseudoflavonifractor sp.]